MLKIIVVDDHEFFRKGLVLTINKLKYAKVIAEAANGKELLQILKTKQADIILMDIKMPEIDGIQATKEVKKNYPGIHVAALSMFGEEEYLKQMINAGIIGFMLKNISKDDLDRALQLISKGKSYYSEELMPFFTSNLLDKNSTINDSPKLSKREIEILKLISEGKSNKEIAQLLFISPRTVTNHRANIIAKTGVNNSASLISYAVKHKLIDL